MDDKICNMNYIYDECDSNQSYSFGKNDNSNQNNNESNDELDSNKNKDNHNDDCCDNESDDSYSSYNDDSNNESSDNNDSDNSNNNFYDDQNKKWKRIKVDNICSEVEGVFSKSEWKKFDEEYDIYIKDIRCENKEEILKDENNEDYKWKCVFGHAIIKFVKRRPKMATQQVRYVTHDEFKVFTDNLNNTLKNYATKDDIKEIKDTLILIVDKIDSRMDSMDANFNKKIDEVKQEIQDVKSDVVELKSDMVEVKKDIKVLKKDVADIKKCPTIQKELSELED